MNKKISYKVQEDFVDGFGKFLKIDPILQGKSFFDGGDICLYFDIHLQIQLYISTYIHIHIHIHIVRSHETHIPPDTVESAPEKTPATKKPGNPELIENFRNWIL